MAFLETTFSNGIIVCSLISIAVYNAPHVNKGKSVTAKKVWSTKDKMHKNKGLLATNPKIVPLRKPLLTHPDPSHKQPDELNLL